MPILGSQTHIIKTNLAGCGIAPSKAEYHPYLL